MQALAANCTSRRLVTRRPGGGSVHQRGVEFHAEAIGARCLRRWVAIARNTPQFAVNVELATDKSALRALFYRVRLGGRVLGCSPRTLSMKGVTELEWTATE